MKNPPPSAKKSFFMLIGLMLFIATCSTYFSEPGEEKDKVERQFSSWDGSHRVLARSVKNDLKDPDSYRHISTTYDRFDDHIEVYMTYMARNSLGGMVEKQVKGSFDLDGKIIKMQHL